MICGVLLAAGGARRFKSQKLVAPYRGHPLVRHGASALRAGTDELIVVVGHDGQAVRQALADLDVRFVANAEWELGLSTSIRCGVGAVRDECDAVVIGVGDQPGLDADDVRRVIDRWHESGRPIVSASYRGQRGHPVLFARSVFPELLRLEGDAGARLLIERSAERVSYVELDREMPPDVDTVEQLQGLEPTS
jgi:CTP:molybdopterin cytidylyltransferase MocA